MSDDQVMEKLPPLVRAVEREGHKVVWSCDPMHGNTELTASGYKTRDFNRVRSEVDQAFDIHEGLGSRLGGLHVELTGENVTECVGGVRPRGGVYGSAGRVLELSPTISGGSTRGRRGAVPGVWHEGHVR